MPYERVKNSTNKVEVARSESIEINVENQSVSGTILTPGAKIPGILFVHGWGGCQQRDLARAKNITGLGCVCLTFDLRGHERPRQSRPGCLQGFLIESEQDDYVPHATLMSYRSAFELAHSRTYRLVDGADHALSSDISQSIYSSMLTNWISEMVIGARLLNYPHHSAKYS